MSYNSKIEWTEATWNVVAGCTKCSPGCLNCYAERMSARLSYMGQEKYSYIVKARHIDEKRPWNNKIFCDESVLDQPLKWKKPRRIFVCSMSDLFHPKVPFEFIDEIMQIISMYPQQHTYLILTKRPEIAKRYFEQLYAGLTKFHKGKKYQWPFKNLHLGVSISVKAEMWKATELSRIPAAVRYISFEPLLEDVGEIPLISCREDDNNLEEFGQHIDWVIVSCESLLGSKAGRFQDGFIEAARNIVKQGQVISLPVYVKQIPINGKVSRKMAEWPKELRVQQYP